MIFKLKHEYNELKQKKTTLNQYELHCAPQKDIAYYQLATSTLCCTYTCAVYLSLITIVTVKV